MVSRSPIEVRMIEDKAKREQREARKALKMVREANKHLTRRHKF